MERVQTFLRSLQNELCERFLAIEHAFPGGAATRFVADAWQRPEGGGGRSCVLEDGALFERAAVNFSSIYGTELPKSAAANRGELSGRPYQVAGVSVIVHPRHPMVPTTHMNVRYFEAGETAWFGGGCDLTPYYGFREDAELFHREAKAAVGEHYAKFKKWCDDYFYLKHRQEARGIGGVFFDDLGGDFEENFALIQRVAAHFANAYETIVERRKGLAYGDKERQFQLYRRGRYTEFNLVWDRGTLFGLQSSGRTESILASLPPLCSWRYDWKAEPGSPEALLTEEFLRPQDWA